MKLASALALPLLALVVVSVLELAQTSRWVDDIGRQTDLARASIGPSGLLRSLQDERTWPSVELLGFAGAVGVPVEGYEETRDATDAAIDAFREQVAGADPTVAEAFEGPLDGLAELERIRADIDANTAPRDSANVEFAASVFQRYTDLIEPFFDATTHVSLAVDGDTELRQGTELADSTARVVEVMSVLLAEVVVDAFLTPNGIDTSEEISRISMLHSEFQHHTAELRAAPGPYVDIAERWFPTELTDGTTQQVQQAITTGSIDLAQIMSAVNVPPDEGYPAYQDAVHRAVMARADELDQAAARRQLWLGSLGLVALAVTVGLTLLVSRSITRPLRSLTEQAKEMAERGLPDAVLDVLETPLGENVTVPRISPIVVKTRDEVADVAEALNTVQDSALDLAVEQAVLRRNIADSFVNLGRRNQNLLSRQLDFITRLEAHEADPDTLASLFRLDHLATRMRRNAESLLVLAGIEPPRRWAAPLAVVDVVRSALGEVETFERVAVRDVEPALVVGSAATDLAHLLAELLENALTFSPPDDVVEVRGRRMGDGGYAVAIIDAGYGMPEDELRQANRRLAGTEAFTVAPSKYLGHYVAGNLAARHGIRIELVGSPDRGITATVALPPALLAAGGTPSAAAPAPGTSVAGGGRAGAAGSFASGAPAPAAGPGAAPGRTANGHGHGLGPGAGHGRVRDGDLAGANGSQDASRHSVFAADAPGGPDEPPDARGGAFPGQLPARAGGGFVEPAGPGAPAPDDRRPIHYGQAEPGGPADPTSFESLRRSERPFGSPGGEEQPFAPPDRGAGPFGPPADPDGPPNAHGPDAGPHDGPGRSTPSPGAPGGERSGVWPPPAAFAGRPPEDAGPGEWPQRRAPDAPPGRPSPSGPPDRAHPEAPGPSSGAFSGPSGPSDPRERAHPGAPGPSGGAFSGPSGPSDSRERALPGAPGPSGGAFPGPGGPTGPSGADVAGAADGSWRPRDPRAAGPSADAPDTVGGESPGSLWSRLADVPPARPATPRDPAGRDPNTGGTTAGGLARRVSGAQLPATQPHLVRRARHAGEAGRGPAPRHDRPTPGGPPGGRSGDAGKHDGEAAAGDVYGFLSKFTAGVQRGLDETRDSRGDRH